MTHISHAACKHRKAIFGPTPGSEHSSSTVRGTSDPNTSRRRTAACLIYLQSPPSTKKKKTPRRTSVGEVTDCVFRRQKPTLPIQPAMTCSGASRTASRLSVPPHAARRLSTAASVTPSLVCDDSMSDTSVAKRLFCPPPNISAANDKAQILLLTRGSVSFHLAVSQPMVSTGAGKRARISRIASYVSRQRAGAGWGVSRARLIALAFFGDDDVDWARVVLFWTGRRRASSFPPATRRGSVVLMRFFERREGPGTGSCSLSGGSSSLNKVTDGSAELCCAIRPVDRVEEALSLFMVCMAQNVGFELSDVHYISIS